MQKLSDYGECKRCKVEPRYSRRRSLCRKCDSQLAIARQNRLKALGLDPSKRLDENAPHPQYPSREDFSVKCNHCGVVITEARALIRHKATHNETRGLPEETRSITPSSASWNN
jgi:hypothetical protein